MNVNLKNKIRKLENISDENLKRMELYSIVSTLILSKNIFKFNKDINNFLKILNINFKNYVLKSRTLILARVLRKIEKADMQKLNFYSSSIKDFYNKEINNINSNNKEEKVAPTKNSRKKSEHNYMDEILKKYSRRKK